MLRKTVSFLLAAALSLTLLGGCASGPREDTPAPVTTEPDITTTTTVTEEELQTTSEATTLPPETEPVTTTVEETTQKEETSMTTTATVPTTASVTTPQTTTTTALPVEPASGTMYARDDVNVRKGPGTSYERVGHLNGGDAVEITGVTENGWYRIKFKDGEYFVSASYLQTDKPAVTTAATTTAAVTTTAAATTTVAKTEAEPENDDENDIWIATWGAAMLKPTNQDEQIPSKPVLENNTVRQQIRVSMGGDKLRLVISNEFGNSDLEIQAITIAKIDNPKNYNVDLKSMKSLYYGGKTSFKVPAGKRITTDVLDYEFDELEDLAITMKLGKAPATMQTLTCHTASRCSTWTVKGDHAKDNNFSGAQTTTAWYYICELDTLADEGSGTIVCLGDSLTDGASVTTNGFSTYPHELARQLQDDDNLDNLAVVNMGIGATALYTYGSDSGKNRLTRDVINTAGVKYCVLLYGINDIGGANSDISQNIINEYKNIIKKCHDNGIKVFGCTLTPNKGSGYYSDLHENIRLKVNKFVMSKDSGFDAYIDLSSAVASSSDSAQMERKYVSVWGDNLHFNDSGYKLVGKTVYENIKKYIEKETAK